MLTVAAVLVSLASLVSAPATSPDVQAKPARPATAPAAGRKMTVYKSPTCGCCSQWIEYMKAHGYTAEVNHPDDLMAVKKAKGVPDELRSCHTTLVGGYVIEGHVPVEDVQRLLRERPKIVGLAAPGMPAGSPGMDVPNSPAFQVIAFDQSGRTYVFATHGK